MASRHPPKSILEGFCDESWNIVDKLLSLRYSEVGPITFSYWLVTFFRVLVRWCTAVLSYLSCRSSNLSTTVNRGPAAMRVAHRIYTHILIYMHTYTYIYIYISDFSLSKGCFPIFLHIFYKFIKHLHEF